MMKTCQVSYCPSSEVGELFGTDPEKCGLGIRLQSLLDPSQAPEGKGTVVIVVSFPYNYMQCWQQAATLPSLYSEANEVVV